MFKNQIINLLSFLRDNLRLVHIAKLMSKFSRLFASSVHHIQFLLEWSFKNPEYFDHNIDLYFQWRKNRVAFPMERGVFSSIAIKQNATVLDLCCGDGFYTYYFYSLKSFFITGIDFDKNAIKWANKNHKSANSKFLCGDIRSNFPEGKFDNIIWDAAIEHFTQDEISELMGKIKTGLGSEGILSGYTVLESGTGHKHLHQHEYEFKDKEDLASFLTPFFKNVQVIETVSPQRTNLYFYASDSTLPLESKTSLIVKNQV